MNKTFYIYGHTHKGMVREINEDHILLGRFIKNSGGMGMVFASDDDFMQDQGMLFAVADGIGGENSGETASKMALKAFEYQFYSREKKDLDLNAYIEIIESAGKRANDTLLRISQDNPGTAGMGCTITGVCLIPSGYLVYNAGDSRVYRYRNGILKTLTNDDTVASQAVQSGQMSFRQAEESHQRHTLTNSLGTASFNLRVKKGPELLEGDMILICSDGLHGLVDHDRLESLLNPNESAETNVLKFLQEALHKGGIDNISVIVLVLKTIEKENSKKNNEEAKEVAGTSENSQQEEKTRDHKVEVQHE